MAGGTTGAWGPVLTTLKNAKQDFKEAGKAILLKQGLLFRDQVVRGIRDQAPGGKAFKPLKPTTIAIRKFFGFKGTKALMHRGDLVNAIRLQELGELSVFVGVSRTAKSSEGEALVDVAKLMEYGSKPIVIKITPKMAALLHLAFKKGATNLMGPRPPSTGVIVVQIPARPFIGPVFEKFSEPDEAHKRFAEQFRRHMQSRGVWQAVKEG